jgi:hypothetical protein
MSSAQFNNFSWPSLYGPAKEVGFLSPPDRPGGYYLSDPDDVFKFTLYWTLIFHLPFNFIAGIYAFFNFLFPPARSVRDRIVLVSPPAHLHSHSHSLSSHSHSQTQAQPQPPPVDEWPKPPRLNACRSRWTFALLVLFSFLCISLVSAVVGAAVIAFVLVWVYQSGGFYMSTWIPFIWAVMQSLIALLEIWPSVVDII